MRDELLAGLAALIRVSLAGEHEPLPHFVEVNGLHGVGRVLSDDREEVSEQLALVWQQLLVVVRERLGRRSFALPQADLRMGFGRPWPLMLCGRALARLLLGAIGSVFRCRRRSQAAFALALLIGCAGPFRNLSPSS
jgi:hypothetical protein